jgi:hypothetical protein
VELKKAFPDARSAPVNRPDIQKKNQDRRDYQDLHPLRGLLILKNPNYSNWKTVQLKFVLVQHTRDEKLMISLLEYLGCGNLYKSR